MSLISLQDALPKTIEFLMTLLPVVDFGAWFCHGSSVCRRFAILYESMAVDRQ